MDIEKKYIFWLAVYILTISFLYIASATYLPMTEDGADHSKTVIGFLLGSGIGVIIGMYFGGTSMAAHKANIEPSGTPGVPGTTSSITSTTIEEKKVIEAPPIPVEPIEPEKK